MKTRCRRGSKRALRQLLSSCLRLPESLGPLLGLAEAEDDQGGAEQRGLQHYAGGEGHARGEGLEEGGQPNGGRELRGLEMLLEPVKLSYEICIQPMYRCFQ